MPFFRFSLRYSGLLLAAALLASCADLPRSSKLVRDQGELSLAENCLAGSPVTVDPGGASCAAEADAMARRLGFSPDRLERISRFAREVVAEGEISGVSILIARNGHVAYRDSVGMQDVENQTPMEIDSLYRIYSMTKPVTAVATMMLFEEGHFQLDDPVTNYIPELQNLRVYSDERPWPEAKNPITIRHLLTHTAGLGYVLDESHPVTKQYVDSGLLGTVDLDDFIDRVAKLPLVAEPGTEWYYSVASDVLAVLVQRVSGMRYDRFLKTRIFDVLGMKDTFFNLPEDKLHRLSLNYGWDPRKPGLQPLGSDNPINHPVSGVTLFPGGHGLVSSAPDYLRFSEMLRRGGSFGGRRILSPRTVGLMTADHLPTILGRKKAAERRGYYKGSGFGLGFGVSKGEVAAGNLGAKGNFFWGGAAGTVFWIDPAEELIVVAMIQRMPPPEEFRLILQTLVYQAMEVSYEGKWPAQQMR